MNELARKLAKECGFVQKVTSGYYLDTNGLVERMNWTL